MGKNGIKKLFYAYSFPYLSSGGTKKTFDLKGGD